MDREAQPGSDQPTIAADQTTEADDATVSSIHSESTHPTTNTVHKKVVGHCVYDEKNLDAPDIDPSTPLDPYYVKRLVAVERRHSSDREKDSEEPPLSASREEHTGLGKKSSSAQPQISGREAWKALRGMINQSAQTLSTRTRRQEEDLDAAKQPSASRFQWLGQKDESIQLKERRNSVTNQLFLKLLSFQKIQALEQNRRLRYVSELQTITQEWSQWQQVLDRLIQEVHHAKHLLQLSEESFHQFASTLNIIHRDCFLDEKGQRVQSSAKQLLLQKQRRTQNQSDNSVDSSNLNSLFHSFATMTEAMTKRVIEDDSKAKGKQAAAQEFLDFSEELLGQAEAMKALGNSVIHEMTASELDIQNSFRVLAELATGVNNKKENARSDVLGDFFAVGKHLPSEIEYGGLMATVGDWWLWDILYHAALWHEKMSWLDNRNRMKGLQESVRYFEDKHQRRLREAVLAVMPDQRQVFVLGGKAFGAALKKTKTCNKNHAVAEEVQQSALFDHENFSKEFEDSLQKKSMSIMQEKHHHRSAIMNRARRKYNPGTQMAESVASSKSGFGDGGQLLQAFGSPIVSQLVHRAQVLERWIDKEWNTTIAVLTVDRFLHLFDCSDLNIKTMPQTAWNCMFPTTTTTRSSAHFQGKGRKKASRATQHKVPIPTFTFNLVICQFLTYEYSRRSFAIKQEYEVGGKKLKSQQQVQLRFKDFGEASHWFDLLQNIPKDSAKFQNFEDPLNPGEGNPYHGDASNESEFDFSRRNINNDNGSAIQKSDPDIVLHDPERDDLEVHGEFEDNMADLEDFPSENDFSGDKSSGIGEAVETHDYHNTELIEIEYNESLSHAAKDSSSLHIPVKNYGKQKQQKELEENICCMSSHKDEEDTARPNTFLSRETDQLDSESDKKKDEESLQEQRSQTADGNAAEASDHLSRKPDQHESGVANKKIEFYDLVEC